MNNKAHANMATEFDYDCFNNHFTLNNIEEDNESFITNERARWTEKMARVFSDEPTVEPEDLTLLGSSASKISSNIDLLSTHIWPKLAQESQD